MAFGSLGDGALIEHQGRGSNSRIAAEKKTTIFTVTAVQQAGGADVGVSGSTLLDLESLWATWPQLVFALMGGFLYRRSEAIGRHDRTHG